MSTIKNSTILKKQILKIIKEAIKEEPLDEDIVTSVMDHIFDILKKSRKKRDFEKVAKAEKEHFSAAELALFDKVLKDLGAR